MRNIRSYFPFSVVATCVSVVGALVVTYIALIAVVMSYAALTVEFSQSVRDEEAIIAMLESSYLNSVADITSTDYTAAGYAKPLTEVFVRVQSATALR